MSTDNKTATAGKTGLFVMPDGKNVMFTFILVSSLFLLWGLCNGLIDTMDKHFQEELHLTLAQSAWVQFAHYLGYFLMAMPAGWLASKLGYKGGIIAGLVLVAVGGFWFIPATKIAAFWAFLLGVCAIAAGLTFLETVANPYTTVLGDPRFAATRINLAQSCNGIGWLIGPPIASIFFYSKDAAGQNTGSQTLYIPYLVIALVVILLAVVFFFAEVPDIKTEDDYHLDDSSPDVSHSIWAHPHFVMAVAAQFLYVAAQAGIFSFFINYMTSELPQLPATWKTNTTKDWIEVRTGFLKGDFADMSSFAAKLKAKPDAVSAFVSGELSEGTNKLLADFNAGKSNPKSLAVALVQELDKIVKQDPKKVKPEQLLYNSQRFSGVKLSDKTTALLAKEPKGEDLARLNRMLLQDAYPRELPFNDGILGISSKTGALLTTLGFACFLVGRVTGAAFLKIFSAHKVLGLYALMNVIICALIFCKLGWLSAVCVFLSFFFMSIMFPTIFALGIFGLGERAKKASAYIVMAIMGGAILPKLMGYVADQYDMSRGFIVPLLCFCFVAFYAFRWPNFSGAQSLSSMKMSGGH
ncbi:MAG: MFS transporter [Tepidisphaeraceae bacterium]|jgi:fucose permease